MKDNHHLSKPEEQPGFPCQECGTRIEMTIAQLLYEQSFKCVACGTVYSKDARASSQALEMLQHVHVASKQLEDLKQRYR
jgi:hypothetical protein